MPFRHLFLLVAYLLLVSPVAAQMPAAPNDAELQQRFAAQLPPIWKLDQFVLEPAVNYGNAVEPVLKRRYTGNLSLKSDTFVEASVDGSNTFVRPVAKAGEKKVAFGILTSEFKAGRWTVAFAHDANPTSAIGQPRELLAGQVIVLGSSEEAAFWKQREAEAELTHKAEVARRLRAAELDEVDRKSEIARASAEALLHAERAKADLEKQRGELEAASARAEAERRAREDQRRRAEQLEAEAIKRTREKERSFDSGLKALIATALPSPWKLQEVVPGETHVTGIDDGAIYEFRFQALLAAEKETFAKVAEEHSAVIIVPVIAAAERRVLTGAVQIRRKQGAWVYEPLTLDNITALRAAGSLRDSFGGRVVVRGSSEEAELRRTAEADASARHAAELAKRQREEELRERDRKAEVAKLTHEADIKAAKLKQVEAEAAAEVASRERRIAAIQEAASSKDRKKAAAAIYAALGEADDQVRGLALKMAFVTKKTLSMAVSNSTGNANFGSAQIFTIEKVDPESGDMQARSKSPDCFSQQDPFMIGAIRGDVLSFGNRHCTATMKLDGRKLVGKLVIVSAIGGGGGSGDVSADPM